MGHEKSQNLGLRAKSCHATRKVGSLDIVLGTSGGGGIGDLTPGKDGRSGGISPGCGCSKDLVEEIVKLLQDRKVSRGNIRQLQHQEKMGEDIKRMEQKMDLIMAHLGIEQPAAPEGSIDPTAMSVMDNPAAVTVMDK